MRSKSALLADYRQPAAIARRLACPSRPAAAGSGTNRGERRQLVTQDREIAALALYHDRPTPERARFLLGPASAGRARPGESDRRRLAEHPAEAGVENLRSVLLDESSEPGAGFASLACWPGSSRSRPNDSRAVAATLAEALMNEQPQNLPQLDRAAGPRFRDARSSACARSVATRAATRRAQSTAAEVLAVIAATARISRRRWRS